MTLTYLFYFVIKMIFFREGRPWRESYWYHFTFRWRKIEVNKGYFEEVPGETSEDYRWWVPYHSTDSKRNWLLMLIFQVNRSGIDTVKGWIFFYTLGV